MTKKPKLRLLPYVRHKRWGTVLPCRSLFAERLALLDDCVSGVRQDGPESIGRRVQDERLLVEPDAE